MSFEYMHKTVLNTLKQVALTYSSNYSLRYNGSSGGYVSTCVLWLLGNRKIKSLVSYERRGIEFFPQIIYSQEAYHATGSIYQDIDLINFIKINIDKFASPVAVTCLPCQAKPIRRLFEKAGLECYIIALVCSAQMSRACTRDYIRVLGLQEEDITDFRYRSGGWPGSVKACVNDGTCLDDSSLWHCFFHSFFYHKKRCLKCQDTFGVNADLAVSDPWLGKRMTGEKDGKSIVYLFTDRAERVHKELVAEGVVINEEISISEAISSQEFTMKRKALLGERRLYREFIDVINSSKVYKDIVIKSPKLLRLHTKIVTKVLKYGMRN